MASVKICSSTSHPRLKVHECQWQVTWWSKLRRGGQEKVWLRVWCYYRRIFVNYLCKDEQQQDCFAHVFITGKQGDCSREEMISLDVLMFLGDWRVARTCPFLWHPTHVLSFQQAKSFFFAHFPETKCGLDRSLTRNVVVYDRSYYLDLSRKYVQALLHQFEASQNSNWPGDYIHRVLL